MQRQKAQMSMHVCVQQAAGRRKTRQDQERTNSSCATSQQSLGSPTLDSLLCGAPCTDTLPTTCASSESSSKPATDTLRGARPCTDDLCTGGLCTDDLCTDGLCTDDRCDGRGCQSSCCLERSSMSSAPACIVTRRCCCGGKGCRSAAAYGPPKPAAALRLRNSFPDWPEAVTCAAAPASERLTGRAIGASEARLLSRAMGANDVRLGSRCPPSAGPRDVSRPVVRLYAVRTARASCKAQLSSTKEIHFVLELSAGTSAHVAPP